MTERNETELKKAVGRIGATMPRGTAWVLLFGNRPISTRVVMHRDGRTEITERWPWPEDPKQKAASE